MKYSEEIIKGIEKGLKSGLSKNKAAAYVGIAESTFYNWLEDYPEFKERVNKAVSVRNKKLLDTIKKATKFSWRPAAWLLSHCSPEDYGENIKQKLELSGEMGTYNKTVNDRLQAEYEKMAKEVALMTDKELVETIGKDAPPEEKT